MINTFRTIIVFCFLLMPTQVLANYVYPVQGENFEKKISEYHYLAKQAHAKLAVEDILALPKSAWQPHQKLTDTPYLSSGHNWFTFKVRNSEASPKVVYFVVKNSRALIDSLLVMPSLALGEPMFLELNENNRRIKKLIIPANSTKEVFTYFHTKNSLYLDLELLSEQAYISCNNDLAYLKGTAIGGYIFLTAGILLLFLASGRKSVLYLAGYFCIRTLMLMVLLGRDNWWIFTEYPLIASLKLPVLTSLSILFLLWFCVELFNLRTKFESLAKQIKITSLLLALYIPLGLLFDENTNFFISLWLHNLTTLLLVIIGWQLMKKAIPLATIFTVIMLVQFSLGIMIDIGIIWQSLQLFNNSELFFSVSFWLNGLLFIFLVSRLMYLQVRAKHTAQRTAFESVKQKEQAQAELLLLQQETQEQLEDRVQERTLELNIAFQELEALNKELAKKSTTDDLTGLYNRRYYDQKIQAEFRRSHRNLTPLSLVLIDIDHFKKVNDNFGHIAGDECLVHLANLMQACLRRSADLGFRYGGEEFCFILPETDALGAKSLAEELSQRVRQETVQYQGKEIQLTISCGISTYQQQADIELNDLFHCADKALYQAKNNGRDQVQVAHLTHSQE